MNSSLGALICRKIFCYNIAAELKIRHILKDIDDASVDKIEEAFTANNLCQCENPVTTAFEVSLYQYHSSYIDAYNWFDRKDILRAKNHGETLVWAENPPTAIFFYFLQENVKKISEGDSFQTACLRKCTPLFGRIKTCGKQLTRQPGRGKGAMLYSTIIKNIPFSWMNLSPPFSHRLNSKKNQQQQELFWGTIFIHIIIISVFKHVGSKHHWSNVVGSCCIRLK